ncbi:MAG: HepT-like ribonuclease domain-containing protein [Microcoleaceae cyanobacterium]
MSSRSWQIRIQDILESACNIVECTKDLTFETFCENDIIRKAVLYDYMIIGEASRHIPEDVQKNYPEIPWLLMRDMRNVVTHEYFKIKLKLIWQGIVVDLPILIKQLENLLEQEMGK